MKRLHTIVLPHWKQTEDRKTEPIKLPELVHLPMLMHRGTPAKPIVMPGEEVLVGQKIGEAEAKDAVPVHASVSGKVIAVTDYTTLEGETAPCVAVVPDGRQTRFPQIAPPVIQSREDFIRAVQESGCVGLSGSGHPTHIKLQTKKSIDMLIINGMECEPYLTADCRRMVEEPAAVLGGIQYILRMLGIRQARLAIADDKPAAVKMFSDACRSIPEITVIPLKTAYPQGAESVLVYHVCGRVIPENAAADDVGVIVLNVSTVAFLYQYIRTGMPLIEAVVTVEGDAVRKPGSLRVPIGTPMRNLLAHCGCNIEKIGELLAGGVMMGVRVPSPDLPVTKMQNGLLAFRKARYREATACIRCGSCIRACPMGLMPMELERAYEKFNWKKLTRLHASQCIGCGSCSYVCPAKRPLAAELQYAKQMLEEGGLN